MFYFLRSVQCLISAGLTQKYAHLVPAIEILTTPPLGEIAETTDES